MRMTMPRKSKTAIKPEFAGWIRPMQVALILGVRYHKARDLMLKGTFGKPDYNEESGELLVPEAAVKEYKARKDAKEAKRGQ
jgi:hypothetical protein